MTNPTGTEELKSCPFCGGTNVSRSEGRMCDDKPFFYVECENCAAFAYPDVWNRRPSTPPLSDERLREILAKHFASVGLPSWAEAVLEGTERRSVDPAVRKALPAALEALHEVSRLTGPGGVTPDYESGAKALCKANGLIVNGFDGCGIYSDEIRQKWRDQAIALARVCVDAALTPPKEK
ncbi:MAG: Lar family restriction alleviation protein [Patescibacteria group bacterium]|nr:Lar family restriction alleviation protein [Patescibacteria group bacterium]